MKSSRRSWLRATRLALTFGILAGVPGFAAAEDAELLLGTSAPLAGPLAQFGQATVDGYTAAAEVLNSKGGVTVGGVPYKVKVIVLDNRGDANQVAGQARKLVLSDKVVALLGAIAPDFNGALSVAADQLKKPIVITNLPLAAWLSARPEGYQYAWNVYTYEPDAAKTSWQAIDMVPTNKKAAIFANTDEDGEAWAKYWTDSAKEFGYEVVYVAKVPLGTTNFGEYVEAAKKTGADIVLGQLIPPDAIALWKQMKALGFSPKVSTCEKCGSGDWWPGALGPIAEGTLSTDIWDQSLAGEQAKEAVSILGKDHRGKVLSSAVSAYSVLNIMVDAIQRAGSFDADAINAEIAKTDKKYSIGDVKFTQGHGAILASNMKQWQNGNLVRIWPKDDTTAVFEFPMPGLKAE